MKIILGYLASEEELNPLKEERLTGSSINDLLKEALETEPDKELSTGLKIKTIGSSVADDSDQGASNAPSGSSYSAYRKPVLKKKKKLFPLF